MIHQVKKLMVANRGEIAIRVLRAASELRLRTVAIYTFEDRYSLHRYKADEAYQIGAENDPLRPYLDVENIIQVAKEHQVDAIHPGYGFLSENVSFARRCREEGIVFIGPDPEVMEQLGDKVAAKILARKVQVPLIEGSQEDLTDSKVALQEAERIGYPVIIKAASGGGGRGMRVVRNGQDLQIEFEEAQSEAITAFGDGTIFLEKFIENPKHIEVQLLGDRHGNIVHLYERDCSVQRRFQKVVEVAPCVTISETTKAKLYEYAIKLGEAVGYNNAGTVEFLVDEDESIYFIEVNPRIQVEHTVTEEITGIDLVRSQILIAQGHALTDGILRIGTQADIQAFGCAIQCRVTTEDPSNDFKPDYGRIIAYRSASGMGIRLDAGSAFPGAKISPFFDSLLVKVTAWGQDMPGAAERLHRALREFRIRGLNTNIGFLLRLLRNDTFRLGNATVKFIGEHPELLEKPKWKDRGTKMLRYLAEVNVNKNPDVKYEDPTVVLLDPKVPAFDYKKPFPQGSKDRLKQLGRAGFIEQLKAEKQIQYTDTTFRDGHQSLLATRMRTSDMEKVAESYARAHGGDLFSMEVWGGATFDVALRFLKEDPWERLRRLRKAIPNVLLQMLFRGSNAVGYAAYPDNLVMKFIEQAAETGIDVFRIFDSLNWVEAMKPSIQTVIKETDALAEVCICYTGDISNPDKTKFTLDYYLDLAKRLEDTGAHILAIKDMAGLLKPYAATELIGRLKETVDLPIHLHTHDTSSIQSTTYLKAIEAGVDIVDVAIASMSGLTSQPSFNGMVAMLEGQERSNPIHLRSLNQFSAYWEATRKYYYAFETELRAGTTDIYDMEIPGGQYSNLRPQARGLGLEDRFEEIKKNYRVANELLGDIIKVTPSSKVVGDLAMFMTSNDLSKTDVIEKGNTLDFPDSVKALMRGDLGQIKGGFPAEIQQIILKGESAYTDRPNAKLDPINFDTALPAFQKAFGKDLSIRDFLSYQLYPKVYQAYRDHFEEYGEVINLPTKAFFYGLKSNEEIIVPLGPGKNVVVKFLNMTAPDEQGVRLVFFELNGQTRSIMVRDNQEKTTVVANRKAQGDLEIGSPLQGSISKILVKEGEEIAANTPLFVIEAMKMESTITAPFAGLVKRIHLAERTLVAQDDLVVEMSEKVD